MSKLQVQAQPQAGRPRLCHRRRHRPGDRLLRRRTRLREGRRRPDGRRRALGRGRAAGSRDDDRARTAAAGNRGRRQRDGYLPRYLRRRRGSRDAEGGRGRCRRRGRAGARCPERLRDASASRSARRRQSSARGRLGELRLGTWRDRNRRLSATTTLVAPVALRRALAIDAFLTAYGPPSSRSRRARRAWRRRLGGESTATPPRHRRAQQIFCRTIARAEAGRRCATSRCSNGEPPQRRLRCSPACSRARRGDRRLLLDESGVRRSSSGLARPAGR